MLRAADVFLPNAAEARRIAGVEDVEAAALALARTGAAGRIGRRADVVVKLGADGALAARADGTVLRVPAMPVDPVDTTGAGDSFDAGFLRAWLDGAELRDCLELGAVCGALSTRAVGGVDAQPTLAEAQAALAARRPGDLTRETGAGCCSSRRTRRSTGCTSWSGSTVGEIHRPDLDDAVPGGKGLNAARAAAALGGGVTAVAIVGGRAGDWILDRLDALGMDVRAIRVTGRDADVRLDPRPLDRAP